MLVSNRRSEEEELLDRTDLPVAEFERSLSDLERANRWLGGRGAVLPHLVSLIGECKDFVDIGCGSGDLLRALSDESKRIAAGIRLVGVDLNGVVLDCAAARSVDYPRIEFARADATALPFADGSFDVAFSSVFIHHLGPDDVILALREAARVARRRVVIADLVRSNFGCLAVWVVARLAFGRLSRNDGPASFRRAYTPSELIELARRAGFAGARLYLYGCMRMALIYDKGGR